MSLKHPPDGQMPDDILNSYFDDLLGTDDLLGAALDALARSTQDADATLIAAQSAIAARPATTSTGAQVANFYPSRVGSTVIPLPVKQSKANSSAHREISSAATATVEPEATSQAKQVKSAQPAFAEPEASPEQKQKLERLLQSARARVVTPAAVQVVETKTAFVDDPEEIQDWEVELATPLATPLTDEVQPPAVTMYQLPGLEWRANGRPEWAQGRFDVLLFKVSGLTLAVPLIALGQIQPITDELTPLFGQADWFMGLQPTPAGKIRTVNTARFVMPERYDEAFVKTARYVVSIDGVPWGLAVDAVNQPITLQPEDVKWRSDRSKRPWLAGTVKDHMCALLDIPRIGQMLIEADKNFTAAHGGGSRQ